MDLLIKSPVEHDGKRYEDGDTLKGVSDEVGGALVNAGSAVEFVSDTTELKETPAQRKAREKAEADALAKAADEAAAKGE